MSKDPEWSQATDRQRKDCERLAVDRGWQVVATYENSELSGYDKRVVRRSALKTVMATTG